MNYPEKINNYTKSLIQKHGFPISYQVKKQDSENNLTDSSFKKGSIDPTFEEKYHVFSNIIHKFNGRILVFFTNQCFCHCRFCFRRNRDFFTQQTPGKILTNLKNYTMENPDIDEIILSGGDLFSLELKTLRKILKELGKFKQILRFHSRVLSFSPSSLTDEIISDLSQIKSSWFVTHFNHPSELSPASLKKIKKLRKAGIPLLNQTVLLKNLNDDAIVLKKLFLTLYKIGIKPYYLHQLDTAFGTEAFNVDEGIGKSIMEFLLKELPGGAVPRYVKDVEGNLHKTILV